MLLIDMRFYVQYLYGEEVEKPLQAVYQRLPFTIHQEDWSTYPHEERVKKLQQF